MRLLRSVPFDHQEERSLLETIENRPAVFALFLSPEPSEAVTSPPYLAQTKDLRRRLTRLLCQSASRSKILNLRHLARRLEFQYVGSSFEARWILYNLNRAYYPRLYRQRLRLKPPVLLKVNLRNRFPRCYATRRMVSDGSCYYGPFPSRTLAERFAGEFPDLFKIRRCHEELHPDPSHPGCIYSQMKMCLAPCFGGCTDEQYQSEVQSVLEFLDTSGKPLIRTLERQREQASEALDFEAAQRSHRKIEKAGEILQLRPELARKLQDLHAVLLLAGADVKTVTFFRLIGGELRGPSTLSLDKNVPSPAPLDDRLQEAVGSLAMPPPLPGKLPPWEHLALLARWYYSSFRLGELVMLPSSQEIPHARLIRLCRKMVSL